MFLPEPKARFGPGEVDLLAAHLAGVDRDTALAEVCSGDELALTPAGAFRTGLKPTRAAFGQVCDKLSAGLYALVVGLLERNDPAATAAAVGAYNRVLSVSHAKVVGGQVLFDRSGRADAFVSARYRPYSNSTALAAARADLPGWKAYAADVDGRWLSVRFAGPADPDGPPAWRPAVALLNNEAGRGAVQVAGGVLRPAGNLTACGDARRATHAGEHVAARAAAALESARDAAATKLVLVGRWADRLAGLRVGLGRADPAEEAEAERRAQVFLRPLGAAAAKGVLARARLWPAHERRPFIESTLKLIDLQRVSWLDVWAAVCRRARRAPPRRRFELESFAWRLLQGRPRVTEHTWLPPQPQPP